MPFGQLVEEVWGRPGETSFVVPIVEPDWQTGVTVLGMKIWNREPSGSSCHQEKRENQTVPLPCYPLPKVEFSGVCLSSINSSSQSCSCVSAFNYWYRWYTYIFVTFLVCFFWFLNVFFPYTTGYRFWIVRQFFAKCEAVLLVQRHSALRKASMSPNFICIMLVMPEYEKGGLSIYLCMITWNIEGVYILTYRGSKKEIIMKYWTLNV